MSQPIEILSFSDRHFWHEGYENAYVAAEAIEGLFALAAQKTGWMKDTTCEKRGGRQ